MDSNLLKTSADDLFELVRQKGKITIEEAAEHLNMTIDNAKSLVDFLVEEKVFGIEYKFTTPYIYMNEESSHNAQKALSKTEFFDKLKGRKLSHQQVNQLWHKYLFNHPQILKKEFWSKARLRNLDDHKIDALWKRYMKTNHIPHGH